MTVAHHDAGLKRDAASVWLEDITASSCEICLRELENYAGSHEDNVDELLSLENKRIMLKTCHRDTQPGFLIKNRCQLN